VTFRAVHVAFAWFVLLGNGMAGAWALAAHRMVRLRSPWLWRFTAVAQVSIAVQVLLGVAALRLDGVEATDIHMFYGFVAMASVAIIYSYRQQLEPWRYLLYGYGGLFLMGLGIRAFFLD
jgi:predicted membrane-bound mannosyltransferase